MVQPPTGTVTFLFTDLEGSTRQWERDRPGMAAALARHDTLLREAVEGRGGHVFKTVGDAVCAAFPGAAQALAAALDAQGALLSEVWGAAGPLRARMALHTGQAEERDEDYFGPPLNRVARLLAAGHGGQVLLSLVAAELARDELPVEAGLRDLGEHRLKDLGRPERVFQLLHPELPAGFPPLKSLDRLAHNLPVEPTPLVGREGEVAGLAALLRNDDVGLVTLTGPGGVGKTRLALQVAADLLDHVPDGAWFVDLAPLADPGLVPSAIAAALGVREEGGPLVEALCDHLRDKNLLLVLDNCEHLLDAAPLVGELRTACPGLKVMATSRAPLRLRAEREVPVAPLPLPDRAQPPPPARLTQYDAVRLFVERAVVAKTDFAVTNDNAPAVAEVCHRLDGLPLAIELAAARVKLFPPEALLKRLERRLAVLTGGARDLPARQRTMRDAIAWSHELLAPEEQALFRRLSVFAGGATLEAIEAVCDPAGELDVVEGLASLVDKSLARAAEAAGGEPRFAMLETIREYAAEQLAAVPDADAARDAHAAYYLALAEEIEPHLPTTEPDQERWYYRLDVELPNLRVANTRFRERGDVESALRLGTALALYFTAPEHLREGLAWVRSLLDLPGVDAYSALQARVLDAAGDLATWRMELADARAAFEAALAIHRARGDRAREGAALSGLGGVLMQTEDFDGATAALTDALAVVEECGDAWTAAATANRLGTVAFAKGDYATALARYQQSRASWQEFGDPAYAIVALVCQGDARLGLGDLGAAAVAYRTALDELSEGQADTAAHRALLGFATIGLARGDAERAARLFGAADALEAASNSPLAPATATFYQQPRDEARRALGDAAWEAAHAAGAALPLAVALAEARAVES